MIIPCCRARAAPQSVLNALIPWPTFNITGIRYLCYLCYLCYLWHTWWTDCRVYSIDLLIGYSVGDSPPARTAVVIPASYLPRRSYDGTWLRARMHALYSTVHSEVSLFVVHWAQLTLSIYWNERKTSGKDSRLGPTTSSTCSPLLKNRVVGVSVILYVLINSKELEASIR